MAFVVGPVTWGPSHTSSYDPHGPRLQVTLANHKSFVITTDKKGSPKTVAEIVHLVKDGFYDGQVIYRVEGWVVQWGDPRSRKMPVTDSRLGSHGSGHYLQFESPKTEFVRGIVGIRSSGPGIGGEGQIFVLTKNALHLNGGYAVLGKITAGMDVVDKIKVGDKIDNVRVLGNG